MGADGSVTLSRRALLAGAGGALIVSIVRPIAAAAAISRGDKPAMTPDQLDSYLAVRQNGTVDVYFGKMDVGHGIRSGIVQIVAEELDVALSAVTVYMCDTDITLNQGGASGSTGISMGGRQMRFAAAEARRVLLGMAASRMGCSAAEISVADGLCRCKERSVSYGELVGGRFFDTKLKWNGEVGNTLFAPGLAVPKDPKDYKLVGKPLPRGDIAGRLYGTEDYVTDIRLPQMLHGRVIRPPVAGARIVSVSEESIRGIAGVRIIRDGDFIAVLAPREWSAVRAQSALEVTWSNVEPPFFEPSRLHDHIRKAPARGSEASPSNVGDVERAFRGAAKVIEAEYEWPFQSHASMAGACAVARFDGRGDLFVWSSTQKPHYLRDGLARLMGLPNEKVHLKWIMGPGTYGRSDADDCAAEASLLAKLAGRPVRLQYSRAEATAWDPKAPPSVHRARAALDKEGHVIALDFHSRGMSRMEFFPIVVEPGDTLVGQMRGAPVRYTAAFAHPEESYGFPAKRMAWETIPPLLERASPLRTSHMRDPCGPQTIFAFESFIDEIAAATGADPLEFRLNYMKDPRDLEVMKKVGETFGWQPRVSPHRASDGTTAKGQGLAFASSHGTRVGIAVGVTVQLTTGSIHVDRVAVAHDCGQVLNPRSLRTTIEGNVMQGISRALYEEVAFDSKGVTSVDWETYPIALIADVPQRIDIALIDRPTEPSGGAGEPSTRPVAAAIANAVFDACGRRVRRAPLTPGAIKLALSQAAT